MREDRPVEARKVPRDVSGSTFEIYLAWSETVFTVGSDQTVLDVLQAAGIAVEPGCGVGGCGHCAMAYVEGDLIHKDTCLTPDERAQTFCPCVSRARSRIVLAL
jgi:ferredoxin